MTTAISLEVELQRPDGTWLAVGVLGRAGETTWFETYPDYWALGDRPVLGQVLEDRGPAWRPSARVALPVWFSHLLPEGRLREAIASAAQVKKEREFHLLARIGQDDLPGAIRVRPAELDIGDAPEPSDPAELPAKPLGPLKFSLAGVQLKFSVTERDRGLTIPATGDAGTWIAKLPDRRPGFEGVPQAELAGLRLAQAVGIEVPEARLVGVADIAGLPDWAVQGEGDALLIERFDRKGTKNRVHAEELAQVLDIPTGSDRFKYDRLNFETVARVVAALCGPQAIASVIDRIVLNVLIGNGDAHAKNWAFRYIDGKTPTLSPAYDIVPTVLYVAGENLGLNLRRSVEFADVRLDAFERLADKAGWDGAEGRRRAAEAVERVLGSWGVLGALLDADQLRRLTKHRDSLPLLADR